MNIQVTTPGKLILIGEYAVLEGAPALVMAVNRHARAAFIRKAGPDFTLQSPTFQMADIRFQISPEGKVVFITETDTENVEKLNFFLKTFEYLLQKEKLNGNLPPLEIVLDTREFYLPEKNQKLGLGSSAALTVALVQGLLAQLNPNDSRITDPLKLFKLAEDIHYRAQGKKGSGIDIAASCFGGIIHFQKKTSQDTPSFKISSVDLPENLIILPVWTGTSASTIELVSKVDDFQKNNPNMYNKIMQNLTDISHLACQTFSNKETQSYLDCCHEYYQLLKELGEISQANIISDIHQEIRAIADVSGAIYKPSGAGGGDIGLVLTDSQEIEQRVSDNLLRSGFEILNLSPSPSGSEVEFTDFSKRGV